MSEIPRVVVTGIGIVSSVGVGCNAVSEALRKGQSGIRFSQAYADSVLIFTVILKQILISRLIEN